MARARLGQAAGAPHHRRELSSAATSASRSSKSIKRWRNSCGEDAWDALPVLKRVIDAAHEQGVPVIYTTGIRRADNWDNGSWSWKNNRDREAPTVKHTNQDGNEIMAQIAPAPQDIVVPKQKPSGFHGTNMLSYLTLLGCDSVIVCGTTTSGCVRATVLDFQLQLPHHRRRGRLLRPLAGEPRNQPLRHAREICRRGGDPDQVLAFFDTLPNDMYELPSGSKPAPKETKRAANF